MNQIEEYADNGVNPTALPQPGTEKEEPHDTATDDEQNRGVHYALEILLANRNKPLNAIRRR